MKKNLLYYLAFSFPLLFFRIGMLRHTDPVTGYYLGDASVLCVILLCVLILFSASFWYMTKRTSDKDLPGLPLRILPAHQPVLYATCALSALQCVTAVRSAGGYSRIQTVLLVLFLLFHALAAAGLFSAARGLSSRNETLTDLLAVSPAAAFSLEMLLRYAARPINVHDSVSILRMLCAAALAVGWLRAASFLLTGNKPHYAVSAGFSLFAFLAAVPLQLPELFFLKGSDMFHFTAECLFHAFSSVSLLILLCSSSGVVPEEPKKIFRAAEEENSEPLSAEEIYRTFLGTEDGEDGPDEEV